MTAIAWAYLLVGRGRFWMNPVRDEEPVPSPARWPSVAVIMPARNEAEHIVASIGSLVRQDYPGRLDIIVIDDDSNDGTGQSAAAAGQDARRSVSVIASQGLPVGWTGKLWALKQGIAAVEQRFRPDYLLLTDADIVHAPDTVAWLTAKSVSGGYELTSLMAKLRCESLAERLHVPAFIYFFQMLFPFTWVKESQAATAAAAGGCVLLKSGALRDAGGIDSIRNALIDDCALARRMKTVGPIWLGLTERVRSIRPYDDFGSVRHMIARSAYAQLRFSPWWLAGTMAGLALTFIVPVLLAVFAEGVPQLLGLAAWLAMAASMQPTLRFYRVSPLWGVALPAVAFLYAVYTLDSAYRHARRRGGQWKGRVHVNAPGVQ
jgi:hopene-associated glycosyltransferase HpnB